MLALVLLQSIYHQSTEWMSIAIPAGLVILAAIRPYDALCVLAAFGPLAAVTLVVVSAEPRNIRYETALALAFLAGWALNRAVRPRMSALPIPTSLRWSLISLLALVLSSAVATGSVLLTETPDTTLADLLDPLVREYLVLTNPLTTALLFAEGLVLMIAAADICSGDRLRREAVLRLMVIGATAAALLNVLRFVVAAVQREDPLLTFVTYVIRQRVNVHYSDLNAAGSYFAMMWLVAAGFALRGHAIAIPSAVLIAAALWLTGSRAGMAAALVTAIAGGILALRGRATARRIRLATALAVLILAAAGVWRVYPEGRNNPAMWSLSTRAGLVEAGLRMAADQPVFGVGIGRFYRLSERYVADTYVDAMIAAQRRISENAHNYFVQLLAELGVPGLLLFLSMLGLALREVWRASAASDAAGTLFAGLIVFLLTCVTGHPLLVAGAAYPFWLALGLYAAREPHRPQAIDRRVRFAGITLVAIIAATVPLRMAAAGHHANLEHVSGGFSRWQVQPDGSRYRWAGGRSVFYVPSPAISVRIPLRHGGANANPLEVVVFVDGREANRVRLPPGDEWRSVRVIPRNTAGFTRIDIETREAGHPEPIAITPEDGSGAVMVGRPVIDLPPKS